MKWQYVVLAIIIIVSSVPVVTAWDELFPWAGTYYEAGIPANVTYIFMNSIAGGGSGSPTANNYGFLLVGYGGKRGEYGNTTMIPVIYGTNYTIIVGSGGKGSFSNTPAYSVLAYNPSINGGDTIAFGVTRKGGTGGIKGSTALLNGGAGESVIWGPAIATGFNAQAGGNALPYLGGSAGTGSGSGGGGAANNASYATYGGFGTDGTIHIWDMNGSSANIPQYTASPTNTGYGNIVTFTDESILNDGANLTYLWDFGDGETSTTRGTVNHVYSTYGVFTTNLTISSDVSTSSLNKPNYITVTTTPITAWYTQKTVPFKIIDAYGADLPGANVSVRYLTNTLPSNDPTYLTSAFGISQAVATQMVNGDIAMQGYTGTDGQISFMMFPAIQYGITITNESAGLSNYVEIYPTDPDYVIRCPLDSQTMPVMADTYLVNSSLYVTEPNASWITWNLLYSDPSGHTTGLTWNVTCWNNMTVMHNNSWGAVGTSTIIVDNYTFPSEPKGMEYRALYDAVRNEP